MEKSPTELPQHEKRFRIIPDSFEEFADLTRIAYCGFIVFKENYREKNPKRIWINKDAGIPPFHIHFSGQSFMGEWRWREWGNIKKAIVECFGRIYVVEEDWYRLVRGLLKEKGEIPTTKELDDIIGRPRVI